MRVRLSTTGVMTRWWSLTCPLQAALVFLLDFGCLTVLHQLLCYREQRWCITEDRRPMFTKHFFVYCGIRVYMDTWHPLPRSLAVHFSFICIYVYLQTIYFLCSSIRTSWGWPYTMAETCRSTCMKYKRSALSRLVTAFALLVKSQRRWYNRNLARRLDLVICVFIAFAPICSLCKLLLSLFENSPAFWVFIY